MRRLHPYDGLCLGVLGCSAALSALLYPRLPARMPIHFGLDGQPDQWASRPVGAFIAPVVTLGLWVLLAFGPQARAGLGTEAVRRLVRLLVVVFISATHVLALRAALGGSLPVVVMAALCGGLWVLLGLLMPRLRRNALVGVRTPATLASDEVWQRTHRVTGYAMVLGGLVALALCRAAPALAMGVLPASLLLPLLHSHLSVPRAR